VSIGKYDRNAYFSTPALFSLHAAVMHGKECHSEQCDA